MISEYLTVAPGFGRNERIRSPQPERESQAEGQGDRERADGECGGSQPWARSCRGEQLPADQGGIYGVGQRDRHHGDRQLQHGAGDMPAGQAPKGFPISHSWPKGSTMRPSRQPCSSATGEVSVAPAASARRTTCSGSSTTSSVRPVARLDGMRAEALAGRVGGRHPERRTADAQLRDDIVAVAHPVDHGCAKRRLVEGNCRAGAVDHSSGWMVVIEPAGGHDAWASAQYALGGTRRAVSLTSPAEA